MFKFLRKNNTIDGNWLKVSDLKVGMQIAVPKDYILGMHQMGTLGNISSAQRDEQNRDGGDVLWDEIESIEYVGTEQVWDIEVEDTHNFVGNNIFAHNTYLDGNLGIGTSNPGSKLGVIGNASIGATYGNIAAPTSGMIVEGNVGIGTTDPGAKLNVHENSNADTELRIMAQATYDPRLYLKSEEGDGEGFKMWYDNSVGDTYFDNIYSQTTQTLPAIRFRTNVNGTTNSLVNAMTIVHNGNVGIGTTTPDYPLHVVTTGTQAIYATATGNYGAAITGVVGAGNGNAGVRGSASTVDSYGVHGINYADGGVAIRAISITNGFDFYGEGSKSYFSGSVGIGTTNPLSKFHVDGPDPILLIKDVDSSSSTGNATLRLAESGANGALGEHWDIKAAPLGPLQFIDNWNEGGGTGTRMVIADNGNVGINTTNPTSGKLEVNQDSTSYAAIYGNNTISTGGVGVSGTGYIGVYGSSPTYGVYGSALETGGIGVYGEGTTYDFYGTGGEYAVGGSWSNGSDRATKENFVVIDNQEILNKIIELPMTQWNYIKVPGSKHIGPIAQDFYALFGLGDSDKSVSTIDPAGIALVGIQALNEKLNTQSDLVTGLAGEMDVLKGDVSGLALLSEEQSAEIERMNLKLGALTGEIIPVAGSDEEKFANDFFANLFVKVGDWLASADNGIKTIFARKISTRLLCIADEAGVETCVEKTQLDNLLAKAGEVSAGEINDVGGVSTDTPTNTEINPGAPVITLVGEATVNLDINGVYNELGANVVDDVDTFVAVSITGVPDNSTDGIYAIHYNAVDSEGNNAIELIRKVIVGTGDYTLTGVSADSWVSGDTASGIDPVVTTDTTTVTDTGTSTTVPAGFDEGAVTATPDTAITTTPEVVAPTETVPVVTETAPTTTP